MRSIDHGRHGPRTARLVREALAAARPRGLTFGRPDLVAGKAIAAIDEADLGGGRQVVDARSVTAVLAGLWLLYDHIEASHELLQAIEDTPSGGAWHGVLHRREPDAGNAGYWFGRVGAHPAWAELARDAAAIIGANPPADLRALIEGDTWHPRRFVDLCTGRTGGAHTETLLAIQRREWELLFDHDWVHAFAAAPA